MFVFIICFYTPTLNKICICICINFRQEVLIIRTFQRRFHVKCRDLYTIMEILIKSRDLYLHREIITCIGKLLLRSSISYFIWQDLIDNLYIYIYRCLYIYRFFLRMGTYIYTRSSWEKLDVCFHLVMYRQL